MADQIVDAESVVNGWLALIDAGNARASWEHASSLFRRAVTEPQWAQSLDVARAPLGALRSRARKSAERYTQLPGAPDGEYVIFQFDSSFAKKQSAVETVTAMRDTDRAWRVSGYFIR